MKVTRALLLSSKKQAACLERPQMGHVFGIPLFETKYRYLVGDCGEDGVVFEIYRVTQETYQDARKQERVRDKIAEEPHVHKEFANPGELINFLRRYQINFEDAWFPVED